MIILATCGNGYCGCDAEEVFFHEEGFTEREIDSEVYAWARENAESFAYVHFGWDEEYSEEDYEDYLENWVTFDWRIVTYEEYVDYCANWSIEPRPAAELY